MWYEVNERLSIKGMVFNFLPSWWHGNYGFLFGHRYVFDPDYRTNQILTADRLIAGHFPGLPIGSSNFSHSVIIPDFGNASTPAAAGCEIFYPDTIYPWNTHISREAISKLKPPARLAKVFPYQEIVSQASYLSTKLRTKTNPVLPIRGVLNDAVLIQGSSFFEDIADQTKSSQNLVDFVFAVLVSAVRENYDDFGFRDMVMICNCTVMMISPEFYREHFLRFDLEIQKLVKKFEQKFGIHHCGIFDKYRAAYRQIPHVDFLAIGWESDLKAALETFPEAVIQYLISPTFLMSSSTHHVSEKIQHLLDAAGGNLDRLRLEVSDIEFGTPEDNLMQIYKCCKKVKQY